MAGPVFNAIGTRSQSGGAATISPAKPTVLGQNGLLICVVTSKNNATHSTSTTGWSKVTQVNSGASFTASIFTAAESAGAPTITWTGSVACSAQIAYYTDPANVVDTTLGATGSGTGSTSTHASSAITTTRDNSLVVYVDVAAANTALATPSGWTENNDTGSATDAGRTVFGNKAVATSGSSSGAISVTGANAAYVQFQLEVMGQAGAANSIQVSKMEAAAWLDPPDGLSISKLEIGAWLDAPVELSVSKLDVAAWLDPPDGLSVSKLEVGAWLDYVGGGGGRRRQFTPIN